MGDFKEWGWGDDFEMERGGWYQFIDYDLWKTWGIQLYNESKLYIQRESNNESKFRKGISTLNFIIYKKSYSFTLIH